MQLENIFEKIISTFLVYLSQINFQGRCLKIDQQCITD